MTDPVCTHTHTHTHSQAQFNHVDESGGLVCFEERMKHTEMLSLIQTKQTHTHTNCTYTHTHILKMGCGLRVLTCGGLKTFVCFRLACVVERLGKHTHTHTQTHLYTHTVHLSGQQI